MTRPESSARALLLAKNAHPMFVLHMDFLHKRTLTLYLLATSAWLSYHRDMRSALAPMGSSCRMACKFCICLCFLEYGCGDDRLSTIQKLTFLLLVLLPFHNSWCTGTALFWPDETTTWGGSFTSWVGGNLVKGTSKLLFPCFAGFFFLVQI